MDYDHGRAAQVREHCFVYLYTAKGSLTRAMLIDALVAYALAHM
jgi:hypothetical protein